VFPAPKAARSRPSRYQAALKGKDLTVAKSYSSKDLYVLGDIMAHPHFGIGVATAIKDQSKVEVLFEAGSKLLVHGR
jgi:hypothetical protein